MNGRNFKHCTSVAALVVGLTLTTSAFAVGTASGTAPPDRLASPSPSLSQVTGHQYLAVSAAAEDDAWLVGVTKHEYDPDTTLARHWDGTAWSTVVTPNPAPAFENNRLSAVSTVAADDAWAVGSYQTRFDSSQTLVLHWDGKTWTQIASPSPGGGDNRFTVVRAFGPDDVWVLGEACETGGLTTDSTCVPLNLHWDGTQWNQSDDIDHAGYLGGSASNDLWASGYRYHGSKLFEAWISHFDGMTWTEVPVPNPGPSGTALGSLDAKAPDDAWVAALQVSPSKVHVMHWDGSSWTKVATPGLTGFTRLSQLQELDSDDIWATGTISSTDWILHWDGTSWEHVYPLPSLASVDLAMVSPSVGWAAGERYLGGDLYRRVLLRWDGHLWKPYRQ